MRAGCLADREGCIERALVGGIEPHDAMGDDVTTHARQTAPRPPKNTTEFPSRPRATHASGDPSCPRRPSIDGGLSSPGVDESAGLDSPPSMEKITKPED